MIEWKIELPEQCPPEGAQPRPGTYLRLVAEQDIDETSFSSQHELKQPRPAFAKDCEWASCSLLAYDQQAEDPFRRARDFYRLKKLSRKYRYFARVELTVDSGVVTPDLATAIHYNLWAFKTSPQPKVLEIVEAENDE